MKKAAFYIHDEGTNGVSLPLCRVNDESGVLAGGSIWEAQDKFRPKGYFGVELACPSNASTANFSIGVANGPWETVITMEHSPGTFSGVGTGSDWSARYQSVKGSNGDVAVGCSYNTRSNWVSRMVYVNGDGDIVPISETSGPTYGNPATGTLLISSNEYAHIRQFLVQCRKFQWAEFDNVSLVEGYKTMLHQVKKGNGQTQPITQDGLSFGPMFERVINSLDAANNSFLNLTTGEFVAPPPLDISKSFDTDEQVQS